MERTAINNCFTNFKKKHLITNKHIDALKKRKVEVSMGESIVRKDECAILEEHVKIVDSVSATQNTTDPTFEILGDLNQNPILLNLFRVHCVYCFDQFKLVPQQRNLDSNLPQHCASSRQIIVVFESN